MAPLVFGAFALTAFVFWFVSWRIGARYARNRIRAFVDADEVVIVEARCHRYDDNRFLGFWRPVRGTLYVTDRRILWKTDTRLWPTKFHQIDWDHVRRVTTKKRPFGAEVGIETATGMLRFMPFGDEYLFIPSKADRAIRLAEAIEHQSRNVGTTA